ncbi:hypothetical protein NB701_004107 [Pantoea ananatis]|nr:hypothetical protein [Pantoea ananatis]
MQMLETSASGTKRTHEQAGYSYEQSTEILYEPLFKKAQRLLR